MAPFGSLTGAIASLLAASSCAFMVPGPAQQISRHTMAGFGKEQHHQRSSTSPQALAGAPPSQHATRGGVSSFSRAGDGALRFTDARRQPAAALEAVSEAGSEDSRGGGGDDLSGLRRNLLLAVWLPFCVYAFGGVAPGMTGDPKDIELITHIYDPAAAGPQTAIFNAIFNSLGVIPATFASLMCGGGAFDKRKQPVPPQPFVFGAFALGFFALAPYLALRNYLPEVDAEEDVSLLEKVLTGKITAVLLLSGAVLSVGSFITALSDPAAIAGFQDLFSTSQLCNISSVDLVILSAAIIDPVREDMRRRGVEPETAKVALFSVPVVGPALWLVVRPAVVRDQ